MEKAKKNMVKIEECVKYLTDNGFNPLKSLQEELEYARSLESSISITEDKLFLIVDMRIRWGFLIIQVQGKETFNLTITSDINATGFENVQNLASRFEELLRLFPESVPCYEDCFGHIQEFKLDISFKKQFVRARQIGIDLGRFHEE